jgi:hypothetical protein
MGEGSFGLRDTNKMNMISHQAVCPDFDGVTVGTFLKPVEVTPEIGVFFEDVLLVVPPLSDLVGVTDNGGTSETSHWGQATADERRGASRRRGHT